MALFDLVELLQTGERTANIMKHLFPVPKPESKRLITFANRDDYISFRLPSYFVYHPCWFLLMSAVA